ncbi:MAG: ABC transporter ATP-binding protein [Lachnospiraceae bacterium]|nr:ABC transporter ATP-binding protein [Lachnospiraceae bacterium]
MSKEKDTKKELHLCVETVSFMLKIVCKEKPQLIVLYVLRIFADIMEKVQDVLLPKFIIDELVLVLSGADVSQHMKSAAFYVVFTILLQLLKNVIKNITFQWENVLAEWFDEYIDLQMADHAMRMDYEHTENPKALEVLNKAKEGMSWYSGGVIGVLGNFYTVISNVIVMLGVITVIALTCPLLIPVQLLALVIIVYFGLKNKQIDVESFLRLAKVNRMFTYIFWEMSDYKYGKDIRLYGSKEMMGRKARGLSDEMCGAWREQAERQRVNSWGIDIVNSFRDGISYFYIGFLALTKRISIGDFSMCIAAASSLYWSLYNIVNGFMDLSRRCNYAHNYLEFLSYPEAMVKGDKTVVDDTHEIRFSHVSFKYPRSEKYVLRDINLTIKSGQHLAVVGLNGAGKTTMIKLLCRLYDVTEGEILIDGINIKEYSQEEYRKLFAVVFQDFQLFAFPLKDNVILDQEEDEKKLWSILAQVGLKEDVKKLAEKENTLIFKSYDENGVELSGGQQQKLAIARALYRNAPIVILDEPTAALDPVAEYEIYKQFNALVGGKTAIYISHRLSSCKFCDRIAVFAGETIAEYGTHEELVGKTDGIYAEMFAAQAQYYVEAQV